MHKHAKYKSKKQDLGLVLRAIVIQLPVAKFHKLRLQSLFNNLFYFQYILFQL